MEHLVIFGLLLALASARVIQENVGDIPTFQQLDYEPALYPAVPTEATPRPTPDIHMFDNPMKKKKILTSYPAVTASEEAFVLEGIFKASAIGRFGSSGCSPLFRPVCAGRKFSQYWPPVTFKNDCELRVFNSRYRDSELKILFEDECENWPDHTFQYWTESIDFTD